MEFQCPDLERESSTKQKIRRVAMTVAMGTAQGLISALMLWLAMSGMGVHGHVVQVGGQEARAPYRHDEETPGPPELNLEGPVNIGVL
jgi:hypothetical protein